VGEILVVPETVSVVGSDDALRELLMSGNCIVIPETEIDVNGMSEDFTTKIDIAEFLPENIRLATDVSSNVLVSTTILPDGSKAFEIPISNIAQENLPDNKLVSYTTDKIEVRIKGSATILNTLDGAEIMGSIDLDGLGVGQHSVEVDLALPAGIQLVSKAFVDITVTEIEMVNNTRETSVENTVATVRRVQ
jgi:YbbR domain-containing protein